MKKMKSAGVLMGGLLLVLGSAGCRSREKTHAAPPVRALETASVERQVSPLSTEVDGVVVGRVEAVLSSRLAARVSEVSAVPGRTVRAGTVLVRLDAGEAEGALAGARAALASAKSALALASKNLERFEKLESRGAAAGIELDRARQDQASATAAVAAAEAAARRAETDRAQALLAAPFDALVVEKMVSPGDLAAPGRPLVRLASVTGRRVEAAPGENEAALLEPGQRAEVLLGDRSVEGRIAEVVGAVDPSTRRRTVRVDLPAGVEPPVGSFARLRLAGPPAPRLLVPSRAIAARGGLEIAWTVGADQTVSLRYVRSGPPAGGGRVEIRSGLEAGDRVVLDPPADLEAGARIRS
ncbi:MAG TPA: efflux RND transporter periplasmic adaptor subunit [Anaeromyxobacter sp.]